MADTRVERLAQELDSLRLEFLPSGSDVVDVDRGVPVSLRRELHAELLGLPDAEAGVAGPEVVCGVGVLAQPKRFDVELLGSVGVLGRNADEVDFGDQGMPPGGSWVGPPRLRSRL